MIPSLRLFRFCNRLQQFVNKVHQFWVRWSRCISLLTKCNNLQHPQIEIRERHHPLAWRLRFAQLARGLSVRCLFGTFPAFCSAYVRLPKLWRVGY